MSPDDRVRLLHISDALSAALRFTEGRSRVDLDQDEMLAFALVHAIQIAGEAAGKVTAELRDQHPEIPWALITGMRHRLVHAYFDINWDILWTTAKDRFLNCWPKLMCSYHWTDSSSDRWITRTSWQAVRAAMGTPQAMTRWMACLSIVGL